jgi:hypothetical protein
MVLPPEVARYRAAGRPVRTALHHARLPRIAAALLAVLALSAGERVSADQAAPPTDTQIAFLKTARIVASKPIGKGITGALRLTLSDGALTHDAAFQSVNEASSARDIREGRKRAGELLFVDSYRYNIAAWELARIVGLEHMMPATIERRHNGAIGALSWWVDDVMIDEEERERTSASPPAGQLVAFGRQRQVMHVFAELVRDTDRNKGNVLYTNDWRLIMLDFTRAFRTEGQLRRPENLLGCDRNLLARLRTLTEHEVTGAVGSHLTKPELSGLLRRRDLIVAHFDQLVKARGEAAILF